MPRTRRRVIKLGGSLLDLADLPARFRRWLSLQPPMQNVVVAGGGRLADVIREAFARHRLDEDDAHWLCIRILGVTAGLAARLLPESVLVKSLEELAGIEGASRLILFETESWLRDEELRSPCPLPHTWDVTSDSIAARLAEWISAEELVLLKSALPAQPATLAAAAESGLVDRYFPVAAADLRSSRLVNLRDGRFPELHFAAAGSDLQVIPRRDQ